MESGVEDRTQGTVAAGNRPKRARTSPVLHHLSREWVGADRGARDSGRRFTRHPEMRGSDGASAGSLLQGLERATCATGRHVTEAQHGDSRIRSTQSQSRDHRQVHSPSSSTNRAASSSRDHVPEWRSEWGGSYHQLECHELLANSQALDLEFQLRSCSPTNCAQDMGWWEEELGRCSKGSFRSL